MYTQKIKDLIGEVDRIIVGQKNLKQDILIALFSGGHILLEGAPGLAKTRTVSSFAKAMNLDFQRIQFTPDLLPSDLIGAKIYDPDSGEFRVKKGPIFGNIILADEINRAPSKVQSALLEAMEEGQVTIGEQTFELPKPFMVLATQNPLEQEGTFLLPEAQLDRFLLKTLVDYPSMQEEKIILQDMLIRERAEISQILSPEDIFAIRSEIDSVEVSESIYDYICSISAASRDTNRFPEIAYGCSPRASLALLQSSKTLAYLFGRHYVIPEDIKRSSYGVMRHRIILSFSALADGISPDTLITRILDSVTLS